MSTGGAPHHDPIPIGEVSAPPFVRLPDPESLFSRRAERFRLLADTSPLKPYLSFMADLAAAQHAIQRELPLPQVPGAELLARARAHQMPPVDRRQFSPDSACLATLDRLLGTFAAAEIPAPARAALERVEAAAPAMRDEMIRAVLADSLPLESLAEHVLVAAALQVHFARLAARLEADSLQPVGDGVCPVCGGPPVSTMVVDWPGAHGSRFCVCSLCSTMWNYVRIRCTVCGSTKGIGYQEIEGGPGTIKAETCSECGSYVKILWHLKDTGLDPVADDVASLGLDLMVRDTGLRRGSFNPFMIGY